MLTEKGVHFLAIEGVIGVGKTSLARLIVGNRRRHRRREDLSCPSNRRTLECLLYRGKLRGQPLPGEILRE